MSQQRGAPLSDPGGVLWFGRNSPTESVPQGREEGLQSDGACQKQEGTLTHNPFLAACRDDGQGDRKTAGVRVLSDLLQDDLLQEDAAGASWGMTRSSSTGSMTTRSSSTTSLDRGQRSPSEQLPALKESGMSFDLMNNPALADMLEWGSSRSLFPAGAAAMDLVLESTGEDAADCALGGADERLSPSEMSELEGGGGGGGGGVEVEVGGGLDERLSSSILSRHGGCMGQLLKERLPPWEIGSLTGGGGGGGGGGTGGLDKRLSSSETREIRMGGVAMEGPSAWCAADETPDGSTCRSSGLSSRAESPFSQSVEPGDAFSLLLRPSFPVSASPASPCTSPPEPRPNHPTSPFEPLESSSASGQRGLLGEATAFSRDASSLKAKWRTAKPKWRSMSDIYGKDYKVGRLEEVEKEHVGEGVNESRAAPQEAAGAAAIEPGDISAMFDFVPSSVVVAGSGGVTRVGTTLPAVDSQAKKKMLESMLASIESEMTDSSKSLFGLARSGEELGIKRYGGPARRRNTTATATATATAKKAEATTGAASDGGIQPQCRRSERSSSSACQDDEPVFQGYVMCEDVFSMILILLFIGCGCAWLIL